MPDHPSQATHLIDAAIVGGGVAGLWLLNLLSRRGYATALFEAETLGCAQTLGSQGMIHGGLKYGLTGQLTEAVDAIAGMPARWRQCLAGRDDVDLNGLRPVSEHYYLFAGEGTLGKLTTFFASRLLRGRIRLLGKKDFPAGLTEFDGSVYELNDFVLDTPALLERLRAPVAAKAYRYPVPASALSHTPGGWRLDLGQGSAVVASRLILAGGAGNGPLLEALGISQPRQQLRGLNQVLVSHPDLPLLMAHCLTGIRGAEPRLTITSHPDRAGRPVWYLGGRLATTGVKRTEAQQMSFAARELAICVPWIDWRQASYRCLRYDRAEPAQVDGKRPDSAHVSEVPDGLVCWPTKLTLTPDLGDRVLEALPPPLTGPGRADTLPLPPAKVGQPPWISERQR